MNTDYLIELYRTCAVAKSTDEMFKAALPLLIARTGAIAGFVYKTSGHGEVVILAAGGQMGGDAEVSDFLARVPAGDGWFDGFSPSVEANADSADNSPAGQTTAILDITTVDNLAADSRFVEAVSLFWIKAAAARGWKSLFLAGSPSMNLVLFGAARGQFCDAELSGELRPALETILAAVQRLSSLEHMGKFNSALARLNTLHQALVEQEQILFDLPTDAELFDGVCQRLHATGLFDLVGIGWPDPDGKVRYHHAIGYCAKELMKTFASPVTGPGGGTLSREVMRTGKMQISNDYLHDARSRAYHEIAQKLEINAWAAIPIVCEGKTWGVLGVISRNRGVFHDAISTLLATSAALLSRTLERRRLFAKLHTKQLALERLNTLYNAILEESKLILTAPTERELLQGTCDTLVAAGPFSIIAIGWPDAQGILHYHYGAGSDVNDVLHGFSFSTHEEPVTLSGTAWRSQMLEFSNNYPADPRSRGFSASSAARNIKSIAVIPVRRGGRVWGIMSVVSDQTDFFDQDLLSLVRNCSLLLGSALDSLDMSARVDRLGSLYKSLSGQWEIVLQAHDEAGLCRGTAEQLANCGLFSTIAISRPNDAGLMERLAVAGCGREQVLNLHINITDENSLSMVAKAWREGRRCFANHFETAENMSDNRDAIVAVGGQSVAAVPVRRGGRLWGVLRLMASYAELYDDEMLSLVDREADQLGHALDEIDLRRRLDAELTQQAWLAAHDVLTGLPNRGTMDENLRRAVARSQRGQTLLAVAMLDINNFKPINDTLGHAAGDLFLQQLAGRIKAALRKTDCAHRLGGDEFVIILEDLVAHQDAECFFSRLACEIDRPFELAGVGQIQVSASIGFTIFPTTCADPAALLRCADAALYRAKGIKGEKTKWLCDQPPGDLPIL